MALINGVNFDLQFCSKFSPDRLKKIYSGESSETLDLLIKTLFQNDGLSSNSNDIARVGLSDSSNEKRGANKFSRKNNKG